MSIPATEPVSYTGIFGTSADPAGGPAKTKTGNSKDKDMFLQLLVAQMKYQDPMNPTDSGQFLAQSAQFTALEKMQSVADQTAQLVSSQMAFGASNLVGRTVSWTASDGTAMSGNVDGVQFGTQGPMLDVGGTTIPIAQVQSVGGGAAGSHPPASSTPTSSAPTSTGTTGSTSATSTSSGSTNSAL